MASAEFFETIPPFPSDIATAPIHTISLRDLSAGTDICAKEVLTSCQELGFFLLDLRGDLVGELVIKEVDELFNIGKDIMNLPDEVKEKFQHDLPRSFLG
jgi:isopenicillin N synthase-like dioxygenase